MAGNAGALTGEHDDAAFKYTPSNPRRFLRIRRVIRSASRAKNREIVDLAVLGMHQDDTALPASKINRVLAGIENWRGTDKTVVPWSGNGFEGNLKACGHLSPPMGVSCVLTR
jgi:hypothetical protein